MNPPVTHEIVVKGGDVIDAKPLNSIQRIVRDKGLLDEPKPKKARINNRADGEGGRWEYAIGKKFWVPTGERIEDVIKRQRKPRREISNDLKLLRRWREERLEEGIEEVTAYEEAIQETLLRETYYDDNGKLIRSKEATPQMRLRGFIGQRSGVLYQAALDLATGVHVQEITKEGIVRRYQQPPDSAMLRYLLDQYHGKPAPRKKPEEPETPADQDDSKGYEVGEII